MSNLPRPDIGQYSAISDEPGRLPSALLAGDPPLNYTKAGVGGVFVGGAAVARALLTHVATGGTRAGGHALVAGDPLHFTGSGGVRVGGAAYAVKIHLLDFSMTAVGGVSVGGAAYVAKDPFYATGGAKAGGAAGVTFFTTLITGTAPLSKLPSLQSSITYSQPGQINAALPRLSGSVSVTAGSVTTVSSVLSKLRGAITGGRASEIVSALPNLAGSIGAVSWGSVSLAASLPPLAGALSATAGTAATMAGALPRPATQINIASGALIVTPPAALPLRLASSIGVRCGAGIRLSSVLPTYSSAISTHVDSVTTVASALPKLKCVSWGWRVAE